MHYDLKDLHLFQAIAEAGNLSSGAAVMHLTASSASYRLKNLEYAVGSQLFTRHPKGMSLTPAGEVLARHTKQLLAGVATMHAELGAYSSHLRGSIRLLANSSSLNSFIIPSLARFLVSNVNINVDLREQESPTISQSIEEGQADIGIGADLERLPGLHRELYAVDRLVCVVSPGHPLAQALGIGFRDVLAYDLVCVERTSSNYLYLSHQARLAGIPMKVRVHVHNFRALIYMVESGVGAAVVPASTAQEAAREQRVVAVPMTDAWAERNLYLVYPKDSGQPELVGEFARILLNDPQVASERESAL
ncbi:LysR substrate-binding domain-containing protein [Bordetella sp. 02P26C-1]|uniref:LysR substrate-binding domain-containing protein n=1 Tax=Bordetella sp. 02P26C-1 TaxID=2683195 RepID=UPI001354BFE2|nr:LysR family transcriptional regulator [Bordetella sp. 02P26C-1]